MASKRLAILWAEMHGGNTKNGSLNVFKFCLIAIIGLTAGTGLGENVCHLPSVARRCSNQTESVRDAKDTSAYADA